MSKVSTYNGLILIDFKYIRTNIIAGDTVYVDYLGGSGPKEFITKAYDLTEESMKICKDDLNRKKMKVYSPKWQYDLKKSKIFVTI